MSAEDLEKYETDMELSLYREYRDIVAQFSYVVETERRFYLANSVDVAVRNADGGRLVVAEVKTRSGTGFGLPAEAVTARKAARIRRLAQRWLAARHAAGGSGFAEVRFDVLAVLLAGGAAPRVEHYEGAF